MNEEDLKGIKCFRASRRRKGQIADNAILSRRAEVLHTRQGIVEKLATMLPK